MSVVGNLIVLLTADSAKFEQTMQSARKRTKEMQQAILELQRGGLDRLSAGMTYATSQQARWQQLSAQGSINLQQLKGSTENVTRAVGHGVEGFRKFENAMVDLGLQSVGLEGKVGRVTEGLLLMGVGGTVTLGVTAGLALIGAGLRARTEEMEALAKKAEEVRRSLAEAFERREADSVEGLQRQLEIEQRRFNLLSQTLKGQGSSVQLMQQLAQSSAAIQELQARIGLASKPGETIPKAPIITWMEGALSAARDLEFALKDVLSGGDRLGRNLGPLLDPTRRGATPEEEAAMRGQGGRSFAMLGVGGEPGPSPQRVAEEAKRRQKNVADFTREVWLSSARNIQSAMADTFDSIFNRQVKSLEGFAQSVVRIVQRAIAQILAAKASAGIAGAIGGSVAAAVSGGASSGASPTGPNGWGGGAEIRAVPSIAIPITVNAMDARGVREAAAWLAPAVAGHVLKAVRQNSEYADAMRG